MSDKNKGTKPSAYFEAENLLIAHIRDSQKYPFICKNVAIDHIKKSMEVLRNAIGCMELTARRADAHGVANKKDDCVDRYKHE